MYRTNSWSRAEVLTLAYSECNICYGLGFQGGAWKRLEFALPCYCVLRAVFDKCFEKYVECKTGQSIAFSYYDRVSPHGMQRSYGLKKQEYVADFISIAKRTLQVDDYKIFDLYFLQNRQYTYITRLNPALTKDRLFHKIYAIKQKLGQAFRSTRPYSIYPIDEYFSPAPSAHIIERNAPTTNKTF